jgi:hypothetical protein
VLAEAPRADVPAQGCGGGSVFQTTLPIGMMVSAEFRGTRYCVASGASVRSSALFVREEEPRRTTKASWVFGRFKAPNSCESAAILKRFFRTPLADRVESSDLEECSEQQLDELCERLYAIHSEVFDGVSREAFEHYVIRSPAARAKPDIFKHRGEWVGYLAIHDCSAWIDREEFIVRHGETGILPKHRKRNWATKKMAWDGVRPKLSHPTAKIYVLGCFVNPATYYSLARFMYELYLEPSRPDPDGDVAADAATRGPLPARTPRRREPLCPTGWLAGERARAQPRARHAQRSRRNLILPRSESALQERVRTRGAFSPQHEEPSPFVRKLGFAQESLALAHTSVRTAAIGRRGRAHLARAEAGPVGSDRRLENSRMMSCYSSRGELP